MFAQVGAVQSDIEKPEKPEIKDVMNIAIRQSQINDDDDSDWLFVRYQCIVKYGLSKWDIDI